LHGLDALVLLLRLLTLPLSVPTTCLAAGGEDGTTWMYVCVFVYVSMSHVYQRCWPVCAMVPPAPVSRYSEW